MKRLNWNCTVKVKLTDLGKDIYYHRFGDLIKKGVKFTPHPPTEDEEGFCKFPVWQFMNIYGPYTGLVYPNVVEDISFYIEDDDLMES